MQVFGKVPSLEKNDLKQLWKRFLKFFQLVKFQDSLKIIVTKISQFFWKIWWPIFFCYKDTHWKKKKVDVFIPDNFYKLCALKWDKVFKNRLSKFFKGCLPQNLLSPFLNTFLNHWLWNLWSFTYRNIFLAKKTHRHIYLLRINECILVCGWPLIAWFSCFLVKQTPNK